MLITLFGIRKITFLNSFKKAYKWTLMSIQIRGKRNENLEWDFKNKTPTRADIKIARKQILMGNQDCGTYNENFKWIYMKIKATHAGNIVLLTAFKQGFTDSQVSNKDDDDLEWVYKGTEVHTCGFS